MTFLKRLPEEPDLNISEAEAHNAEIERREKQDEESKTKKTRHDPEKEKPKKTINYIPIDEDTWKILIAAANKTGDPLSLFCADLLVECSTNIEKTMSSRTFKLNTLRRRSRMYFEQMSALEQVAAEYNSSPSNELADILISMCDELGKDPEEIKRKAMSDPMSEAMANFRVDPGTKTARCKKWMVELMRKYNYKISSVEGNALGDKLDYSKDMIAQVRRKLGITITQGEHGEHYWVAGPAVAILGGKSEWNIRE